MKLVPILVCLSTLIYQFADATPQMMRFHPDFKLEQCVNSISEDYIVCKGEHIELEVTVYALVSVESKNQTTQYILRGKDLSDQLTDPNSGAVYQDFKSFPLEFTENSVSVDLSKPIETRVFWDDIRRNRATSGSILLKMGAKRIMAKGFWSPPF